MPYGGQCRHHQGTLYLSSWNHYRWLIVCKCGEGIGVAAMTILEHIEIDRTSPPLRCSKIAFPFSRDSRPPGYSSQLLLLLTSTKPFTNKSRLTVHNHGAFCHHSLRGSDCRGHRPACGVNLADRLSGSRLPSQQAQT